MMNSTVTTSAEKYSMYKSLTGYLSIRLPRVIR